MTNEKVLKKALTQAEDNGWDNPWNDVPTEYLHNPQPFELIFSHSFAKAFWGIEHWNYGYYHYLGIDRSEDGWKWWKNKTTGWDARKSEVKMWLPAWQYHLQVMVLVDNPIRYLEKFLEHSI